MSATDLFTMIAGGAGIVAVYYTGVVHLGSNFITERKFRKYREQSDEEFKERERKIVTDFISTLIDHGVIRQQPTETSSFRNIKENFGEDWAKRQKICF